MCGEVQIQSHRRDTVVVATMVLNVNFSLSATIASDPMVCNVKIEPLFPEYLLQSIYIHI